MKVPIAVLSLALLIQGGCAGVPFDPVDYQSVTGRDPESVRRTFENRLPSAFEVVESSVFRYRSHIFSALGYTKFEQAEDRLAVAGVSLQGMKMFELEDSAGNLRFSFSMPALASKIDPEEIGEAMAEDIRRIYTARVPGEKAEAESAKDRILFHEQKGKCLVKYVFGGPEAALTEKSCAEEGRKKWRVRYFGYHEEKGLLYPNRIFYENLHRGYTLTLRLKEVTS